jgi:hypothetical protein
MAKQAGGEQRSVEVPRVTARLFVVVTATVPSDSHAYYVDRRDNACLFIPAIDAQADAVADVQLECPTPLTLSTFYNKYISPHSCFLTHHSRLIRISCTVLLHCSFHQTLFTAFSTAEHRRLPAMECSFGLTGE